MDETTLPRFKAAGFDVISLTVSMETLDATVRHIAMVLADIRAHSDTMSLVRNLGEALEAKKAGKLALAFHLQETNPLDGDIHMIEVFYELGVRHMLLAYNQKNRVGDGCAERNDGGLSRFGVRVVQRARMSYLSGRFQNVGSERRMSSRLSVIAANSMMPGSIIYPVIEIASSRWKTQTNFHEVNLVVPNVRFGPKPDISGLGISPPLLSGKQT